MAQRFVRYFGVFALAAVLAFPALRSEPVWAVSTHRRMVALTFDDGPDRRFTPSILSTLNRYHAHATFFVLGPSAEKERDLIRREAASHDEIACHGWLHVEQIKRPTAAVVKAFRDCANVVHHEAHAWPHFARAPYGLLTASQVRDLGRAHLNVVDWGYSASPDVADPKLIGRTFSRIRPGTIVLLHDGRDNRSDVVRELPRIVRELREHHYEMVTIDELLRDGSPRYEPARAECARERLYSTDGFLHLGPLSGRACRVFV